LKGYATKDYLTLERRVGITPQEIFDVELVGAVVIDMMSGR